jgi:hypothetical protein
VAGIDSTVVAVALPAIGRNPGFQALQWTVTSYALTLRRQLRVIARDPSQLGASAG